MLTRMVDGIEVILTAQEEAEIRAEWAANLSVMSEQSRVSGIDREAQSRIISHLPRGKPSNFIIKELNLLMLDNELNDILLSGGTLTAEQNAQKIFFRDLKDKIKAIRGMANTAEAGGDSIDKFKNDLDLVGL